MKIGVTGTRTGMTEEQFGAIELFLRSVEGELHHGDCIGVDVEVAELARELGYRIICHPPVSGDLRANHASDEVRKPLTYFARNRKIVDECDLLLVVPYQKTHQPGGGTWYTHDYAVKRNKQVIIFPGEG